MKIGIEHHNDQFNVTLTSSGGSEPFLTVKGCRIIQGQNGPFVSWPARKLDSGKYWNHVYASRAFGDAVVAAYNKSKAAAGESQAAHVDHIGKVAPRVAPPQHPSGKVAMDDMEDDIPF